MILCSTTHMMVDSNDQVWLHRPVAWPGWFGSLIDWFSEPDPVQFEPIFVGTIDCWADWPETFGKEPRWFAREWLQLFGGWVEWLRITMEGEDEAIREEQRRRCAS